MREILFRGQSHTGVWAKGFYTCEHHFYADGTSKAEHIISDCIYTPDGGNELTSGYEIKPETLGQYTGTIDKKGKQIFEGDIVWVRFIDDADLCVVTFEQGAFFLSSINGAIRDETLWHAWYCDFDIEVVGNIHDNPELLEVTDDA